MISPRQRIIDDTDPVIQYSPNDWSVADPQSLQTGNFGPIFHDTSHFSDSSNSSISFPFNANLIDRLTGTSISVYGTINTSTTNDITDPTWDCLVDRVKIPNGQDTFASQENNWLLCSQPNLPPGPHVLTIQVHSQGQPFYFDYLAYTPLSPDSDASVGFQSADPEPRRWVYSPTDAAVSFGPGWRPFGGENGTNEHGSQVSVSFYGTQIVPYGFIPTEFPHSASWATYTMDDGTPINFTLPGLSPSATTTQYFMRLVTLHTVSSGLHTLVITYGGDLDHTPLCIGGFYVTDASTTQFPSESAESSILPSPSHSSTPANLPPATSISGSPSRSNSPNPTNHIKPASLPNILIGGILAFFLLASLAFYWIRRRRRGRIPHNPTSLVPYVMSGADIPRRAGLRRTSDLRTVIVRAKMQMPPVSSSESHVAVEHPPPGYSLE
ncbi:hypothetical protein R3P38DRAFT_3604983 [Favolaschia claudopus]|uniref:Transmembrane protein n=1 Tax=Favolaschia claudopus TaxID=2862362 RepID=A0AAW0A8A2_9AGAR